MSLRALEIKKSRAGSNKAYFIPYFSFMFRETGRRINTEINYTNEIANSQRTWDQTKPKLAVLSSSLEIVLLQGIFHEKKKSGLRGAEIYVYMLRLLEIKKKNSEEYKRMNICIAII